MTIPDYDLLNSQARALIGDEPDPLACAANFVGLLFHALDNVNWLGIYVLRGTDLVLGPFQGQAACTRIPLGNGVCGVAAARRETLRVADVHEFPGHIACDVASRSEIVVPLIVAGELIGVLDIDSPLIDRFSADDQVGIEALCRNYCELQATKADFI